MLFLAMGLASLALEPSWGALNVGDKINVQCAVVVFDPEGHRHLCRSLLGQQLFLVRGQMPNLPSFSFLEAEVLQAGPRFQVDIEKGYQLGHETPTLDMYSSVIELCSGIGIMGDGLTANGLSIRVVNDLRAENCSFQERQGQSSVVPGDVASPETIAAVHAKHPFPAMVTAGFSCQPWSRLGDGGKSDDPRAGCLGSVLEAAYWLKAHSILLECVDGAGADQHVQDLIQQFCRLTQFRPAQLNMKLDQICPARRDRWWCLLTNPTLPELHLRPLPSMSFGPTLGDMLPIFPEWGMDEIQGLVLDRYELNKFMEFDSLFGNIVDLNKPVKTALHGWGNQLMGCPCKCRSHPFSEARLKSKGLFGALVPIGGFLSTYLGNLPLVRHMHPWEMALIHGARVDKDWGPNLRFAVAGLGQMASPVQSCWVAAQFMYHVSEQNTVLPEVALWSHFSGVFQAASIKHPNLMMHPRFQTYVNAVYGTLYAHAQAQLGPAGQIALLEQEQSNSHRKGRQNPQSDSNPMNGFDKQPGSGSQEPQQDAVETQGLPQPMFFQAKPADVQVGTGPSHPDETPCALGFAVHPGPAGQEQSSLQSNGQSGNSNQRVPDVNQTTLFHHRNLFHKHEGHPLPGQGLSHWHPSVEKPGSLGADVMPAPTQFVQKPSPPNGSFASLLTQSAKDAKDASKERGLAQVSQAVSCDLLPVTSGTPNDSHDRSKLPCHAEVTSHQAEEASMPILGCPKVQELTTSHREGRKNPLCQQSEQNKKQKQPGHGSQEPIQDHADEAQGLNQPIAFQAMPLDAFVTSGPSPHPCQRNDHAEVVASQSEGLHVMPSKGSEQPVHPSGGIAAFATKPIQPLSLGVGKMELTRTLESAKQQQGIVASECLHLGDGTHQQEMREVVQDEEIGAFSQEMLAEAISCEAAAKQDETMHFVQIIHDGESKPILIKVHPDATVGSITVAEEACGVMKQPIRANTSTGRPLPLGSTTKPYQQVFLRSMTDCGIVHSCPDGVMPAPLMEYVLCPRIQALYHQEGWVAKDEIEFYLNMIVCSSQARVGQIMTMPEFTEDEEIEPLLQRWLCNCAPADATPGIIVTVLWVDNHWFPVAITLQEGVITIATTPGGSDWIRIAARGLGAHITVHEIPCQSTFPNDCGFQAVGWLMSAVFDSDFLMPHHRVKPITPAQADTWRNLFERHLLTTNKAELNCFPGAIIYGGANAGEITTQLVELLKQRGVPETVAADRAQIVIDKLGRQPVSRAFRTMDPWRELKQLANQATPKLQIVLPSELQDVIQAKAKEGGKIGDKTKKAKHESKPKKSLQILASDVSIPEGVFCDRLQQPLQQVSFAGMGPEARGIVVLNAEQAVPYMRIVNPISKHALGLIVLDHQAPIMQGVGDTIRFPARCEKTAEAILLTAKLVQLGAIAVERAVPEEAPKVEEVYNRVLRTVTYRDEFTKVPWKSFVAKPIKHVVEDIACLRQNIEGQSPILDVWDRQFLTDKLERTKPELATIFMACFRLEKPDDGAMLTASGSGGHYLEPRSEDGRAPDANFRVIWLNKVDKQTTVLASQSTPQWNCVVRSGTRYGLRVRLEDAEAVHIRHKPSIPFLNSDRVMIFHAGPFPHGSNRAALTKLFTQWKWPARPCQPKSRSPNGLGVIWEVHATERPQFEVYQLQHADVLLTEVERKSAKPRNAVEVQGSAKTLAALKHVPEVANEDPWIADDPWGNYKSPAKQQKASNESIRPADLDIIASKVALRIQEQKPSAVAMDDGDTTMSSEDRVAGLEERISALETNIQQQHMHQQTHNKTVADQINLIQRQVDSQGTALQQHMDQKMEEQLSHIERLLGARDDAREVSKQRRTE